jgi:hypothetical protein
LSSPPAAAAPSMNSSCIADYRLVLRKSVRQEHPRRGSMLGRGATGSRGRKQDR